VDKSEYLCISLCENKIKKVGSKMKIYSCQDHIDQALEDFIEKFEAYPIMEMVTDEEKLSTECNYCDNVSLYVVANK